MEAKVAAVPPHTNGSANLAMEVPLLSGMMDERSLVTIDGRVNKNNGCALVWGDRSST